MTALRNTLDYLDDILDAVDKIDQYPFTFNPRAARL